MENKEKGIITTILSCLMIGIVVILIINTTTPSSNGNFAQELDKAFLNHSNNIENILEDYGYDFDGYFKVQEGDLRRVAYKKENYISTLLYRNRKLKSKEIFEFVVGQRKE